MEKTNNPPLLYRKIFDELVRKTKRPTITPKQFRIVIAQFGICKQDWIPVANELRSYGFFDKVTRHKIVIKDEKE